jgi:hypothetical protein
LEGEDMCQVNIRADDRAGNSAQTKFRKFSIDFGSPVTAKEVGEPKFDGFVTSSTPITLTAADALSGVLKVCYRIGNEDDVFDSQPITIDTEVTTCAFGNSVTFSLEQESLNVLEFWAVDNAGNEEDMQSQIHYVDNTPPITEKSFDGPFFADEANEFITADTEVTLAPSDMGENPVGVEELFYRSYLCDTQAPDFAIADGDVTFTIPEESCHVIEYYSVDKLGNAEPLNSQIVFVDSTPPTVSKEIGEPEFVVEGGDIDSYISSETPITLTCSDQDPHPSGAHEIFFKIFMEDSGGFQIYTQPFTIPEEGTHTLEYFCVDNVGHESGMQSQMHAVDNTPPVTTKQLEGKLGNSGVFVSDVIVTLTCEDEDSGCATTEFSVDSGEMQTYDSDSKPVIWDGIHTFCHRSIDNVWNEENLVCQEIIVDTVPPQMVEAFTGPTTKELQIFFSEDLDPTTVEISDFAVTNGDIPMVIVDMALISPSAIHLALEKKFGVDDTPTITLIGEVSDMVGRVQNSGTITAQDGITPEIKTLNITLYRGWNFISTPKGLVNSDIGAALADVDFSLLLEFDPFLGFAQPASIEPLKGYWIKVNTPTILTLEFASPSNPPTIPIRVLYGGWNAIGTTSAIWKNAEASLVSIDDDYSQIVRWNAVDQKMGAAGINGLPADNNGSTFNFMMGPGRGYWVFVLDDIATLASLTA